MIFLVKTLIAIGCAVMVVLFCWSLIVITHRATDIQHDVSSHKNNLERK